MSIAVSSCSHRGPELAFAGLDVLWIQLTGTLCNIACKHCFISCGPKNLSHRVMTEAEVLALLAEARDRGVKEYYFTGGEPFLHDSIEALIAAVLRQGPLSILTNGLLIDAARAKRLSAIQSESRYSLDLRLSLDGIDAAENDPIRGRGTFERILGAAHALDTAGLDPVFTVTTVHARYESSAGRDEFTARLRELGFRRTRVKFIPPFRIGREARRAGAYDEAHVLPPDILPPGAQQRLLCGNSRTVSANGVFPCPILIEEEGSRLSSALGEALGPIELNHPACRTCHVEGFSCRT